MTLIRCISRLRNCGIFRTFDWPTDLPEFGRFNLIYGWNGTGKTTLSRVLRHLEKQTIPEGEVKLKMSNGEFEGKQFPDLNLPIRVFNRDFVNESVFRRDGGALPPIFVFGRESVEKQKQVDQLKRSLADAQTALQSAQSKMRDDEKALDKYCIDRATNIRETLRSSGSNPYNNYDKSRFRTRAQSMIMAGDKETHRLSEPDRDKLLAQHRANAKPKLQPIAYQLPDLRALAETASELLSTTVVSATIQTLKEDAALSAWVRQGLGLHQERHVNQCLFCEQELPRERLSALEAHFNAEYEQLMQRIDTEIERLKSAANEGAALRLPNRSEFYDDLAVEYDAADACLRRAIESTKKFLHSLVQLLTDKKAKAFERLVLTLSPLSVDYEAVTHLNTVVNKHNQACDDFQGRVSTARKRLEDYFVSTALDEFQRLKDSVSAAETAASKADVEAKRIAQEIANLEREIVEHHQPAEELNDDLRNYLGHSELCLEIKETGYAITRNGTPAQALSEGEMTAIALLYFLKSLKDRRFDLAKGVVVLDDPVSSLDANALYLAFGFIRERTKDAGQLFIFTHNFTFFRQVRNWFHYLPNQKKENISRRPARFYMLNCVRDGDQRCATICQLVRLLEKYESEYHYLFACIYRAASSDKPRTLQQYYVLPNMGRRLLESFLAFRRPDISGDLWKKMASVDFEEAKKLRILRFLNTHSHSDTVGDPEHDPSFLGEARSVLKDLLELIESEDKAHYEAMVKLANGQAVEEGDE